MNVIFLEMNKDEDSESKREGKREKCKENEEDLFQFQIFAC